MQSGLYKHLISNNKLIGHEEIQDSCVSSEGFLVIKPEYIPFISYPYEWCFSQLKDAALLTLEIQLLALSRGMSLKDASAYNVQFRQGKPIFIDTLSFEEYVEGRPWVAYKQFCEHFLAPLALMSHVDISLNRLLQNYIDGIPLSLARHILPRRTLFSFSLGLHIHLHGRQQNKSADENIDESKIIGSMSKRAQLALIDSLKGAVQKLKWSERNTEWADYYDNNNNYTDESLLQKENLVRLLVEKVSPDSVWDLGANDGRFSRIAAGMARNVISWDIDTTCVEHNYLNLKNTGDSGLLPLFLDLTNPSPSIGWSNSERPGFMDRGPCDLVLALGLIHHLAISNNLPLILIADSFSRIGNWLLLEFVPKEDSQVQKLLSSRKDIFPDYNIEQFKRTFCDFYTIEDEIMIENTSRTLLLLQKRQDA